MNQITIPAQYAPISTSLRAAATALGQAKNALFQVTNSVTDPATQNGPNKTQTDYANGLGDQITALQIQADFYEAQGS
jgi:hypothetical protein